RAREKDLVADSGGIAAAVDAAGGDFWRGRGWCRGDGVAGDDRSGECDLRREGNGVYGEGGEGAPARGVFAGISAGASVAGDGARGGLRVHGRTGFRGGILARIGGGGDGDEWEDDVDGIFDEGVA